MISVISPAKSLNFDKIHSSNPPKTPQFLEQSAVVMKKMKSLSEKKIAHLMDLSKNLAALNYQRYQDWTPDWSEGEVKEAVFAFTGDVYQGLDANSLSETELNYLEKHIRILSGLHGLLRPLDGIKPYRLEMGTQINIGRKKNLYEFWKTEVTQNLNELIAQSHGDLALLNVASDEYFKAIDTRKLKFPVVKANFFDRKNGEYKMISFFAKKARGMMARYIAKNEINCIKDLEGFNYDSYQYDKNQSTGESLVFKRNLE